ncbi:hypothetical protein AB0H37_22350 [Actinomadura sp. NPDC023710]|uniref:hypothetical protein n=1 Tax=Actinomadura sp. NPDC023710 TaxID=3158219 RepID=UPI0033EE47E4
METSYSHTTVMVEPDGTAVISVSLYPDGRMAMTCPTGVNRAQLWISHARARVLIAPTNPEAPTAEDVETARKLAEVFARYAAEVERLHALNDASTRRESAA